MRRSGSLMLALTAALLVGACSKGNEKQSVDTTTTPGTDTVAGKAVPTTDTVVKTTTTSMDTTKGKVNEDSVKARADSQKAHERKETQERKATHRRK